MKKSPLPVENKVCGDGEGKRITGKEALVKLLRWHFGHPDFRDKQLDAIQAALSGRDCFCLMPTGGGKSMCYQIPALAKPGIVLVVSPLIALMENQVMALKEKGIAAEFLSSTQTSHAKNKIHEDLDSGRPSVRLLYVTPELIATPGFMAKLRKIHSRGLLSLIAIDEAHCISTWGHDFRPSYRKLSSLRNYLPDVPMLALTATAVPKVQKDVIESLCLQDPLVLKSSFNRPNIYYEVRYKDLLDDVYADLSSLLKSSGDVCAIVYCLERTTCDGLAAHLSKDGISCAAYHAGLNNKLRSSLLDEWISSKIQVVVATVAFGWHSSFLVTEIMVFLQDDRKDVRIVCHFNIPKSMEAFCQESGRAGRDQLPSKSVLYYGVDDRKRMEFIISNSESKRSESSSSHDGLSKNSLSDFKQIVEYCEGSGCRRKKILDSFGEKMSEALCKKSCDACKHPNLVAQNLEKLTVACTARRRYGSSGQILISPADMNGVHEYSEFWNHCEDQASSSEEDISDSDDGIDAVKSITSSNLSRQLGIKEKIEFLQRAEEKYCQNKNSNKQVTKPDKNSVSETLREGSKQRLLNAVKQRLGNVNIEFESAASFLENECFMKYGNSGKTFYYSQVASTVRWLSTVNSTDLTNRLAGSIPSPPVNTDKQEKEESPEKPSSLLEQKTTETSGLELHPSVESEPPMHASPLSSVSGSLSTKLPAIPSFSEFVNRKKGKDNYSNTSQDQSPKRLKRGLEKR